MGTYTPVDPNLTGHAPNLVAVAASDVFPNEGNMLLHVHNGNASTLTVTIKDQGSVSPAGASSFDGDVVETLATSTDKYFGPFDMGRFNDASGNVTVQYSLTSTVTAEVIDVN